MIEKRGGSGGEREGKGGKISTKNVLVMKCKKNVNIPYCGEYKSVDIG